MCQSHSDLISWLSLKIAGLHLDAAKAVSSRPIPISAVGITSPAGSESQRINWTVLRHCASGRYAALSPISSETLGSGSGSPSAMARARR